MVGEIVRVDEVPQEIVSAVNERVAKYNSVVEDEGVRIRRLAFGSEHIMCHNGLTLFFVYESGKYCDKLEDVLTDIDLEIARRFDRSDIDVQSFPFGVSQSLEENFQFLHNYDKS